MNSPNPNWKPGDKVETPFQNMETIDLTKMATPAIYKLLISAIVPRPIAFVSTLSRQGKVNLAPFSYFNGVSSNPACIMIAISRKRNGEKKDTWQNIEETGQFVVNSANEWLIEPLVYTSAEFAYGVDEMQKVGLTSLASAVVKPPRVKESAFQMECELYKTLEIGEGSDASNILVVGRILLMHVAADLIKDGKLDFTLCKPIARLGGLNYCKIGEIFGISVPPSEGGAQ